MITSHWKRVTYTGLLQKMKRIKCFCLHTEKLILFKFVSVFEIPRVHCHLPSVIGDVKMKASIQHNKIFFGFIPHCSTTKNVAYIWIVQPLITSHPPPPPKKKKESVLLQSIFWLHYIQLFTHDSSGLLLFYIVCNIVTLIEIIA